MRTKGLVYKDTAQLNYRSSLLETFSVADYYWKHYLLQMAAHQKAFADSVLVPERPEKAEAGKVYPELRGVSGYRERTGGEHR